MYGLYKLSFDRGDIRLECFNKATDNNGLWYVFLLFRIGTFFISYSIHRDNNMRLALPLDQFECVPHTDVELMLRVWRRKCFTGFREDIVYGFRLPLWYLHTLLTWFFHFKSCLIIRPRYLASSNDSSGWTWRV
jgi:hypothetical protein